MSKVRKVLTNKYFATTITLVLAYSLTLVGYKNIWALFGASNQLVFGTLIIILGICIVVEGFKKLFVRNKSNEK